MLLGGRKKDKQHIRNVLFYFAKTHALCHVVLALGLSRETGFIHSVFFQDFMASPDPNTHDENALVENSSSNRGKMKSQSKLVRISLMAKDIELEKKVSQLFLFHLFRTLSLVACHNFKLG